MMRLHDVLQLREDRGLLRHLAAGTRRQLWITIRQWDDWSRRNPQAEPAGGFEDLGFSRIEQFAADLAAPRFADVRDAGQPRLPGMPPPKTWQISPHTVNKHLRHLHGVARWAWKMGLVAALPEFPYVRAKMRLPRPIPFERLDAIYRACSAAGYPRLPGIAAEDWWQALMMIACSIGFRREALLGLRWADVDWAGRLVRLRAECDKTDEERIKPLNDLLIAHLLRIRGDWERVLPWPHSPRTFYREWHRIQDAAGLSANEHHTVHDLKKTCGTLHAAAGVSPHALMQILDHKQIATSLHYVQASREVRDAVERIAAALPPAFRGEAFGDSPGGKQSAG